MNDCYGEGLTPDVAFFNSLRKLEKRHGLTCFYHKAHFGLKFLGYDRYVFIEGKWYIARVKSKEKEKGVYVRWEKCKKEDNLIRLDIKFKVD